MNALREKQTTPLLALPPEAQSSKTSKSTTEITALPQMHHKLIDNLENAIADLQEQVNQSDFFSKAEQDTKKILNQLSENESKLDIAYSRWQELDEL